MKQLKSIRYTIEYYLGHGPKPFTLLPMEENSESTLMQDEDKQENKPVVQPKK